ncbi:hypothetical protein GC56T2_1133 [Geobacillus sp. C56-T2]|nr:hypothetical protein GC56T2_1133 [Geobacillus sp. C56-T2]
MVHPVDSNTFLYRVQATIKHNVLLNCLRLFFIMGRKGGFSSLGGGQNVAHGSFFYFLLPVTRLGHRITTHQKITSIICKIIQLTMLYNLELKTMN